MKKLFLLMLAVMLVFSGVAGLMLAYPQPAAAAATLIVTTNSDTDDDATISANLTADTADGDGLSLREAINWAVAGDTVTFADGLSGLTVTLSGTQLTINKNIILDGDLDDDSAPDITVSGNSTSRVIYTTGLTAAARLEGLTIRNGNAPGGGGIYNDNASPTITNCTFIGNTATGGGGGGILIAEGAPTITNCTFSGNTATGGAGGGIYCHIEDDIATITNSIFWGDSGGEINAFGFSLHITVTYSDVQGGYAGGNIDTDPLFADPGSGDYHLKLGSPCIDAGTNEGAPLEDIEGNPRPIDGDGDGAAITDMGAYEYVPPPPPPPPPIPAVGGEAYPVNKLGILAPWLSLAMLLIGGMTCFTLRRHRART